MNPERQKELTTAVMEAHKNKTGRLIDLESEIAGVGGELAKSYLDLIISNPDQPVALSALQRAHEQRREADLPECLPPDSAEDVRVAGSPANRSGAC